MMRKKDIVNHLKMMEHVDAEPSGSIPRSAGLLPCPFCGSDEVDIEYGPDSGYIVWYVLCSNCQASGPLVLAGKGPHAKQKWNERARQPKERQVRGDCSATSVMEKSAEILARRVANGVDNAIREAINNEIGANWKLGDLDGRMESIKIVSQEHETICIDGKPIMQLWPVEVSNDGRRINAKRNYRILNGS